MSILFNKPRLGRTVILYKCYQNKKALKSTIPLTYWHCEIQDFFIFYQLAALLFLQSLGLVYPVVFGLYHHFLVY